MPRSDLGGAHVGFTTIAPERLQFGAGSINVASRSYCCGASRWRLHCSSAVSDGIQFTVVAPDLPSLRRLVPNTIGIGDVSKVAANRHVIVADESAQRDVPSLSSMKC